MPRRKKTFSKVHKIKYKVPRRKASSKKKVHNPKLKISMRRKGVRLVHGYETKRRKK
jgi:hypothetical protein